MRRALLGAVVTLGILPAANAAASPFVVAWSGGLEPGVAATGVVLREDGSGQRLARDAAGRLRTRAFAPRGAKRAAIRAAARQVLAHAPSSTIAPHVADGGYVTVAVQDGAKSKFVYDANADSAQVVALLRALDDALPRGARLSTAQDLAPAPAGSARARVALLTPGGTGVCGPGNSPTHVTRQLSLSDSVAAGVVSGMRSKGTVGGDAVAVDATWRPDVTAGKVTVTFDAEVTSEVPGMSSQAATELLNQTMNADPKSVTVDGQDVSFAWHFTPRAPDSSPGCVIQVVVHDARDANGDPARPYSWRPIPVPLPLPGSSIPGSISVSGSQEGLAGAIRHESGHAGLGLGDRYSSVFHTPFGDLPVDNASGLALDRLMAALHVSPSIAETRTTTDPDGAGDVMGDHNDPKGNYSAGDIRPLLARAAIAIHADPGTVLVNKATRDQNFGIGSPFDLNVPVGKSVHEDGIVAYCLDLLDHGTPGVGTDAFDVLPKAGQLGGEAMSALQRVLDVVAARSPGPLEETPGANAAIWRVTDDLAVDPDGDPAAVAILQAAGVPLDPAQQTFAAPHFSDPAAALPHPVALASPSDPTPLGVPSARAPAPRLRGTKLTALHLARSRLRAPRGRAPLFVLARVTLAGRSDRVSLLLTQRRGARTATLVRTPTRTLAPGTSSLLLVARHVRPGSYRVLARGAHGGTRSARIVITRAPRGRS